MAARRPAKKTATKATAKRPTRKATSAARKAPTGLGTRGRRLWGDVLAERRLGPGVDVLLEEACRIADRLDAIEAALAGRAHGIFTVEDAGDDDITYVLMVDAAVSEHRMQAGTLRLLIGTITDRSSQKVTGATAGGQRTRLDELRARREAAG